MSETELHYKRIHSISATSVLQFAETRSSLYWLPSGLHYNTGWKRSFYKHLHSVPVSGCLVSVRVNQVRIKTIHRINSSSWHHPRHCFLRQILSVLSGKKYHQLSERKVWHHSGQEELRCSGYRPARLSEQDRPSLLCLLDSLARKVMRNIPSLKYQNNICHVE